MNNYYTERKTIKYSLSIDSLFREDYNNTISTDFVYTLPEPINKVTSMKLTAIEFLNSIYTFSSQNNSNRFIITLYNCPTPSDIVDYSYGPVLTNMIVIPEGNYRSDLLLTTINNIFSNTRNGLEYLYFDINEIDTKCIFRTKLVGDDGRDLYLNDSLPPDFYFTVDFRGVGRSTSTLYNNAGWTLGFRTPFYTVMHDTPAVTIYDAVTFKTNTYNWFLKSESSYGSTVQNYIFLEVNDFNSNFTSNIYLSKSNNDSYLQNNILDRISMTSGMNTIIIMSDQTRLPREYFSPVRLETLHIRLVDKYGNTVNFNGNDISLSLEIEQLY